MATFYTIKLRRGLSSDWTAVNPILAEGETGWELDTRNFKQGDGSTAWNDLPYIIDANDRMPDVSLEPDNQILLTLGGQWVVATMPTSLPDATGQPDGKILITESEEWVIGDAAPGGDPNAMLSAPPNLLYTYDTVEPTAPADGDIWTNPEDDPPNALADFLEASLIEGEAVTIVRVGDTFVISGEAGNNDVRWTPLADSDFMKEFRDVADLTGAVRVDKDAGAVSRMVVNQGGDSLSVLLDGATTQDVAGEMHGYVWPRALAVGESLQAHILDGGPSYNYSWLGPVVSDGVIYGSGNQVFFPLWSGGAAPNPQDGLWTGWNTRAAFADRGDGGFLHTPYMRIRRATSNTWAYEISTDGKTWITLNTRTLTMTPTHIGLGAGQWGGTGKRIYSIDHLRVTA